ncbi:MAG: hypothetical protein ACOVLH_03125 [Roseateles sp.]
MSGSTSHQSSWQLWRCPLGLAIVSLLGLITALVSDDLGDWIAWLALGLPLVVAWHFGLRRRD